MPVLVITIIFLSIVVINLLIGFQERKQRKRYYSLFNAEHTKSFFAIARNELMCMVVENKIDTQTEFFKNIYHLNTVVMRSPDAYADISRELTKILLNFRATKKQQLTENEKKISYLTADALGHIVINYSSAMRFLFMITKRNQRKMNHVKFIVFLAKIGELGGKIAAEREIKKTRKELYKISDNHTFMPC